MLKKKPDTSSKHKTKENSGKTETANRSPNDKKKMLSVTCRYLTKNTDAESSTTRPKRQTSADISSSSQRAKNPKKSTTSIPCTKSAASIKAHYRAWLATR